ncbi:Protein kinase C-binding protein NELL2 [Holothuria leucospilota]|uniref:Protein kinase C-binding protein NELL2 n=1 Tax=Holothuria leucospilota TaxID=206669 RepID=A0A9Q1H4X6_HOLLE|nr:Protein kinase C-binding protein NELL2 [Holothuria leucospilota]
MNLHCGFRIGLVALLTHLVLGTSNYGIDPATEIDLTKALSLDIDNLEGVSQVPGFHNNAPAFMFDGTSRMVRMDDSYMMKLMNMLSTTNEFTMMVTFLQDKKNSGSVICISKDHNRYMDLFVSTRNGNIKFYYTHDGEVRFESFEVDLTPNEWHQVAISVSGQEVTLHVDCEETISVRIPEPDLTFSKRDLEIWLGQRGPEKALYKGYLQDARIIAGSHAYVAQCPTATRDCPTCAEYMGMTNLVSQMEKKLTAMEHKLTQALNRLADLETCECVKDCEHNGEIRTAGEEWTEGCTSCSCKGGQAVCTPVHCEPVYCNNPYYEPGQCCPSCLRNCSGTGGTVFHHGDYFYQKSRGVYCTKYQCKDGTKSLVSQDRVSSICATPSCPSSQRFSIPGSCCEFCNGHNFCSSENLCEAPKICLSHSTFHECVCPGGYMEEGLTCVDIDECSPTSSSDMHCQSGTVCVNILGSYHCDCLPGHQRLSDVHVTVIDECSQGGHNCSSDATCVDSVEGYHCICNEGFTGNGETCIPECSPPCQNGGQCQLSGECLCPRGYKGRQCQNDVDECERGIDDCTGNSHCVNLVGSHHCECNPGYSRTGPITDNGESCQDIDECAEGHTCHKSRLCNNLDGSYECRCSPGGNCDPHCWITKKKSKKHGAEWDEQCNVCTCESGVTSCAPKACDCSATNVDLACCPQCEVSDMCMHQSSGVVYQNRETWTIDCQSCQCMDGVVSCSPLECPAPNCPDTYTPIGECCPHCQLHRQCTEVISSPQNLAGNTKCVSKGVSYANNERWLLEEDFCTECVCQGGSICCNYNSLCSAEI